MTDSSLSAQQRPRQLTVRNPFRHLTHTGRPWSAFAVFTKTSILFVYCVYLYNRRNCTMGISFCFFAFYELLCSIISLPVFRSSKNKRRNNLYRLRYYMKGVLCYKQLATGGCQRCSKPFQQFLFLLRPHFHLLRACNNRLVLVCVTLYSVLVFYTTQFQ